MLFCTQQFLLFFLIVFAVYWALPWRNVRIYVLLIASFYFYATWNKWLAILIVVSTTIDYCIALRLDLDTRPRIRKLLVTTSIVFNLGILSYFKYANFFLASLEDALKAAGAQASLPVLSVILPIGISFYTFEAISYVVDVYRRKIRAEKNLAHFMLFILFFPHLIAGPIVRGSDFLPQLRRKKRWNWMRVNLGIQLFVLGMVKKLMIGDRLALLADPVYANPGAYDCGVLWLAAIAYAVQVYCDFSGYTDMALGTAHLLGYRLAFNFNLPFLAPNVAEFWRRWHLTLSNWLRDYVYIPLGGSRFSGWCTYRNLFITMTLCGMWHGASWNFVLFGVVQAICLSVYRIFRKWVKERPNFCWALESPIGTSLSVALTFLTFCVTLVIFRAGSLATSWTMLQRMFTPSPGSGPPLAYTHIAVALALFVVGLIAARDGLWKRVVDRMPSSVNGFAQAAMITIVLLTASHAGKAFIYFQF
jgi:alginate O-acetyltransferase complex protein AlgI